MSVNLNASVKKTSIDAVKISEEIFSKVLSKLVAQQSVLNSKLNKDLVN